MSSSVPPDRAPLTSESPGLEHGRVLVGRYRLESLIASGGMAQVWEGTDEVLQRKVAVKVLHPHLAADATFVARFRHEAVAAARLAHPGIVSIYDTCSEQGHEAIVMELVTGPTLRQRIDSLTPIDPWQAAGLAAQVAEALDAAHRAGLVHRDIKPANVLLCGDGRVKVADFGIAKAMAEADLTQPGLMVGTAKYLAPEQVRGAPVDRRTDIYSLGVMLYEMLCGRPPFSGDTHAATALARLNHDPLLPRQVRAGVPKALEDIVVRAMAREPDDRFDTAADLRAALLAAGATPTSAVDLGATTIGALPLDPLATSAGPTEVVGGSGRVPASPSPSFRDTERSWLVPTALVVLVAVALGIAGLLLERSGAGGLFNDVREVIGGGATKAAPLQITSATAFDPAGDGVENNDAAHNVLDGKASTAWRTEGYDNRDITRLKPGVGIILTLAEPAALDQLELQSTTNDWRVVIYVASSPASALAGWGEPVATTKGLAAGTSSIDLHGARGAAVLIWIVDRGDGPGRAAAEIQEARLIGV